MRAVGGANPRLGPGAGPLARRLSILVLVLLLAWLPGGCQRSTRAAGPDPALLLPTPPAGALQEVAPPPGVQQLQARLQERHPRLRIEAPADGAVLPGGEWTLELSIQDWPLVDAGALGLGPHLVVQIDQQAPRRITAAPAGRLSLSLPALEPGSHRVTVYAARPWGEAVKGGGASDQIRVHRVAPNPLGVPAAGTPQLIPVSPESLSARQPVLIDWLLRDAPLQGLRDGDGGWRLRITVNGDGFLVDENTPLWLSGWRNGANTVLMELVDGQGDPLNPPFNSVVREVVLDRNGAAPAWALGPLSAEQQALLLGDAPIRPAEPIEAPSSSGAPEAAVQSTEDSLEPVGGGTGASASPAPDRPGPGLDQPVPEGVVPAPVAPGLEPIEVRDETVLGEGAARLPEDGDSPAPAGEHPDPGAESGTESGSDSRSGSDSSAEPSSPSAPGRNGPASPDPEPAAAAPAPSESEPAGAGGAAAPEILAPSSRLEGSAREQVNPDGSLIRPARTGLLGGLRERWWR